MRGPAPCLASEEEMMNQDAIQARIGTAVTEVEMVDMLKAQPIGTSPGDVCVRGGVLSFSFGPGGVVLTGAEQRTPLKSIDAI